MQSKAGRLGKREGGPWRSVIGSERPAGVAGRSASAGGRRQRARRARGASPRGGPRPGARARRRRRRVAGGRAEPARHLRPHGTAGLPARRDPRLGRRGRRPRHRAGGRDLPAPVLGRPRGRAGGGVRDPRRADERDVRRARVRAARERPAEAGAALLDGGGGAAPRRSHGLPGALLARPAARRRDRPRPGRGQRCLDDGDPARRARGGTRPRHLVLGREDRARGRARRGRRCALHRRGLGRRDPGACGRQRCRPRARLDRHVGRLAADAAARRPPGRLRCDGLAGGVAPGPAVLLRPVLDPRHDDGEPGRHGRAPARRQPRQLASGDRLGAPPRRRGRGAPTHRGRRAVREARPWRSQADGPRPPPPLERSLPAARAGARVPRALLRGADLLPRVDVAADRARSTSATRSRGPGRTTRTPFAPTTSTSSAR